MGEKSDSKLGVWKIPEMQNFKFGDYFLIVIDGILIINILYSLFEISR